MEQATLHMRIIKISAKGQSNKKQKKRKSFLYIFTINNYYIRRKLAKAQLILSLKVGISS